MIFGSNDRQKWRDERLAKVSRVASKILGMTEEQMGRLVVGLFDSKGHLVVIWDDSSPTDQQKAAFGTAWSLSGENETSVTHEQSLEGLDRWV